MRFSLSIDHGDWARGGASEDTLALAQRVDEAGFHSLWLTEDPDGWDAFALLAAISQRTKRIQLASGVTNPYLRHPDLIAASVATLDRLAPGRVVLGIGRGQPEWYERALGMEIGSPRRRLEETISLLHQWWSLDGTASIEGEFSIDRWTRVIRPQTTPRIVIAAAGPKALDLAGRVADGVFFNMLSTPEYLAGAISRTRSAASTASRDPDKLEFIINPDILVTDDPSKALAGRKRFVATVLALPGMEVLLQNPALDVEGIMQRVRALMKTDEILAEGGAFSSLASLGDVAGAVAVIPDELVERGSAIGSLEYVRTRISEFASLGVTELMVARKGLPPDVAGARALLEALCR